MPADNAMLPSVARAATQDLRGLDKAETPSSKVDGPAGATLCRLGPALQVGIAGREIGPLDANDAALAK